MSYQKFTKDVGIVGLTNILIALRSLIILPIITKLLGVESYGIWVQIIVTVGLLVPFVTLGLPYTLVRFLAGEKNKTEIQDGLYSVLILIFIITSIVGVFLFVFSQPVSSFWGCESILIKILAFVILFEGLNSVFYNVFRAFQKLKKYSFFSLFQVFGEIGLVVGAVLSGHGLLGAVLSLLIIRIIVFLAMAKMIIKKTGIKMPRFLKMKEYLKFSLPTIPGSISSWMVDSGDKYLIGYFLGVLFVGYYAPAYIVGQAINLFMGTLSFVMPATLTKLYEENKINEVKTYIRYCLKYFLMISIPSVFGLSVLAKQLLTIFSTPEIAAHSYQVVPLVAVGFLLFGASVTIPILFLKKKTIISGTIWITAALLNLGLNFIFIPKFGITGAAITTLIAYTTIFTLSIGYCYLKYRELLPKVEWSFILKSIFASILMSLFILWFNPFGLLKTLIAIILGALIYGILIFLLKGFSKNEIIFFKGFLREKFSRRY